MEYFKKTAWLLNTEDYILPLQAMSWPNWKPAAFMLLRAKREYGRYGLMKRMNNLRTAWTGCMGHGDYGTAKIRRNGSGILLSMKKTIPSSYMCAQRTARLSVWSVYSIVRMALRKHGADISAIVFVRRKGKRDTPHRCCMTCCHTAKALAWTGCCWLPEMRMKAASGQYSLTEACWKTT